MAMLDLFSDGDPVVEWDTSMTDKDATEQEIDVMGVKFMMQQEPRKLDSQETHTSVSSSTIGTGNIVWDGSMSAVALLEAGERTNDPDLKAGTLEGKKCLELGSGCAGLGGLACALLGASRVVVTDVASITPLLQRNTTAFLEAASHRPVLCKDIQVMELEWGNPAHMSAVAQAGVFDFVVCNDVLYCADDIELIGATLQPLLHDGSVVLFVASHLSPTAEKALKVFVKKRGLECRVVDTSCLDARDRHEGIRAFVVPWRTGSREEGRS